MPTTTPTTTSTEHCAATEKGWRIRIGIAKPKVKMPNDKDDYTAPLELSTTLRDSLIESLKGEEIDTFE